MQTTLILFTGLAGEARREVLALRKHKEESALELTESIQRIAALEDEVRELRDKLEGSHRSEYQDDGEGWGGGAIQEGFGGCGGTKGEGVGRGEGH